MDNLFLVGSVGKWMVLTMPVAITSLKIGVDEWKTRGRKAKAERRMAASLARAMQTRQLDFETVPGRPFVNIFQGGGDDESDMQLIPSPRSLVRSKPWFSDMPVPAELESRIVKVYTLGPTSNPEPVSMPELMCEDVIPLPAAPEPHTPSQPLPMLQRPGRKLCDFFSLWQSMVKPAPRMLAGPLTPSQDAEPHNELISWNTRREASLEIGRLAASAFPIAAFHQQGPRRFPLASALHTEPAGFTTATPGAPALPLPAARGRDGKRLAAKRVIHGTNITVTPTSKWLLPAASLATIA
jgi:hypothetical protein